MFYITYIFFAAKTVIVTAPKDIYIESENQTARFSCSGHADSATHMQVTWLKDDVLLRADNDRFAISRQGNMTTLGIDLERLNLSSVQELYAGHYSCRLDNGHGSVAEAWAELVIGEPPEKNGT